MMNLNVKTEVCGLFRLVSRKKKSGLVVHDSGWFHNLITDTGLNQLGSGGSSGGTWAKNSSYFHVGTGSTAPAVTDTALVTELANRQSDSINTSNSGAPDYYSSSIAYTKFPAGVATGNLAEIGMSLSGTTLCSRALILDGAGNPTTFTVASDEELEVYYELRHYPKLTDSTGSVTDLETSTVYNYTLRAAQVGGSFWNATSTYRGSSAGTFQDLECSENVMGSITGIPASSVNVGNLSFDAYTTDSFSLTARITIGTGLANFAGGIKSMYIVLGNSAWQWEFDTPIPKTSDHQLQDINFTISWARKAI